MTKLLSDLVMHDFDLGKGQLISKCLFGVFNSSKKRTKKFDSTTMVYDTSRSNCFHSFFGRIQNTKKTFRNWLTFSSPCPIKEGSYSSNLFLTVASIKELCMTTIYYKITKMSSNFDSFCKIFVLLNSKHTLEIVEDPLTCKNSDFMRMF